MAKNQLVSKKLADAETQIERGRSSMRAGLKLIHDKELYLETHESWESYVEDRWEISRSYSYQLLKNEEIALRVSAIADTNKLKDSHLREIGKIPEKKQAQIYAEVAEKCEAEHRPVGAKDLRKAAKQFITPPEKKTNGKPAKSKPENPPTEPELERAEIIATIVEHVERQLDNLADESLEELHDRINSGLSITIMP